MSSSDKLELLNSKIQPFLKKGETVSRSFFRSKYGWNYGGFSAQMSSSKETITELNKDEEIDKLDDLFTELLSDVPKLSKNVFTFTYGKPATFKTLTLEDLQSEIKEQFQKDLVERRGTKIQLQVLYFLDENDSIDVKKTGSILVENSLQKYNGSYELSKILEILYYHTGKNLEQLLIEATSESFSISSLPANSELGWKEIPPDGLLVDEDTRKRVEAIKQARTLRQRFYAGFGKVSCDALAPIMSPLFGGGSNWPAGRPQYRRIQTPTSTLLITDGFTDPFENERHDQSLQYNGHAAEFYFEFKGDVPMEKLHSYAELLNFISQNMMPYAIKDMLLKSKTAALNMPDGKSYLIMNVPSENIPADMQLNLEKILLVSCKIMGEAERKKYGKTSDKNATKVRNEFMEEYVKNKEFCYQEWIDFNR